MRNPGTSFLNVLGLSAGFTCMLLTLTWVITEFSFDRFHHQPDNLFKVMTHVEADGSFNTYDAASAGMDVSSVPEVESIVTVATGTRWPNELCFRQEGNTNDCVYINGVFATEPFFSTFDFPITSGEKQPLAQPATIAISENMAKKLYGNSNPIGKIINVDDHYPVTVTAVFKDVPANSSLQFQFVLNMKVFAAMRGLKDDFYRSQFLQTFVRTNQPISTADLTAKLNGPQVLTENLKKDKLSYEAFPLENWRLKSKFEDGKNTGGRIEYINIFLVITVLVVILAIINFINVSTARATIRAKEIGIRKVTGAVRVNIITQFIGESFMIVLLAFALAAGITQLSLPFLGSVLGVQITAGLLQGWIPLFLLALLIVIALIAGAYPAFVMAAFQPIRVLKNQVAGLHGSNRLRKMLLVVQVSISLGILSFGGVLFLQLKYMSAKDLGIDHENIVHVEPTFRMLQKFDAFKNELAKDKSILQASTATANPINLPAENTGVSWQGKPEDQRATFQVMGCSHEFVETFNLKVLRGRNFLSEATDTVNTEIIVTEDAVDMMGMKDPIGAVIHIGAAPCVIVGVVNNFYTKSLHEQRLPVILYRNAHKNNSFVYVKYAAGTTAEAMEAIAKAYKAVEPSFTMKYWFQDERFDEQYKTEQTASLLVSFFSTIALIIACIGIVGLATFNALRRMKELSIRKVFGATGIQLMSLLTQEFGWIFLAAVPAGLGLVWFAADKWLSGFAYHVSMPWWLFVACTVVLCVVTVVIVISQGLRAVVSNPGSILRND